MRLDEAARKYLGVKFLHQGRNPQVGIDCVGLVVLAASDCGIPVWHYDHTGYSKDPANGQLEARLKTAFGDSKEDIQPGDVVSIDFRGATRHLAVVGQADDGLTLIHTSSSSGRVSEHRLANPWLKRITGIYRLEAV